MALAIRFDQLIRDGVVADQAKLARLGYVTPLRISQILALLELAPDVQEAILFLPPTERCSWRDEKDESRRVGGPQRLFECPSNSPNALDVWQIT
jgi:hypothetical protein